MKKSVLLIDDSKLERTKLREALESAGYEVEEAENGQIGFEIAIVKKPDLIILDLIMPRLGGLGVLNMLQSDLGVSHIPVIILTANEREDEKEEALKAGAKMFLSKQDTKTDVILSGVENLIGKA